MWFTSQATEVAIDQIRGFIKPSKSERAAAFELFVELSVRVTVPAIEGEGGSIRSQLDRLGTIPELTSEIIRRHGLEVARGRSDGNLTLAAVALRVVREIIEPRLAMWEIRLSDHEDRRSASDGDVPPGEWEFDWDERTACEKDLEGMRREVRAYLDTLAAIAGASALTDLVVPVPPSTPVPSSASGSSVGVDPAIEPRRKMVRWLSPVEAARTEIAKFGIDVGRLRREGTARPYEPIEIGANERGETWIDYVSDLGDGFDPTAAVAWQLSRPSVSLPLDRTGELADAPPELLRGSLLVMGGDQVYPHASDEAYAAQLVLPYSLAASRQVEGTAPRPDQNVVVAIPGNHDWYGGPEHFERIFVDGDEFAGHWRAAQHHRWWVVKLPHGWWIWGIDTGLDNTVDEAQRRYFEEAAEHLKTGDRIIVCSPVPLWQLSQKKPQQYSDIRTMLAELTRASGARMPLFLSGDSHFFAHYRRFDGVAAEDHITAGGGGAFLQPTHNLPEQVPFERGAPEFKLEARWPRPVESRSLGTKVSAVRDSQFWWLFGVLAALHVAYAGLIAVRAKALTNGPLPAESGGDAVRWVLGSWVAWPLLAVVIVGMVLGTAPNSRESQLVAGSRKYGFLHGVVQAAVFVAVAALARWIGPDAWWWRFVVVPIIGGVASTIVFVAGVRRINQMIRANDTLAYSSSHLTRFKHFLRMRIDTNGDLAVYAVGLDPVGRGWYDTLTSDGGVVPPFDPDGAPKLHYVWGKQFVSGDEQQVLEWARSLGWDHPDTVRSRIAWAHRLRARGDTDGAEEVFSQALESSGRLYGDDHAVTAGACIGLAEVLLEQGDHESAIGLMEWMLSLRRDDQDDPQTPELALTLARAHLESFTETSADPDHHPAMRVMSNIEFFDHAPAATFIEGRVRASAGDELGARECFERSAEGFASSPLYGPRHPSTLEARAEVLEIDASRLAGSHVGDEEIDEEIDEAVRNVVRDLEALLAVCDEELMPWDPITFRARTWLSVLRMHLDDWAAGIEARRHNLRIAWEYRSQIPPDDVFQAKYAVARALRMDGDDAASLRVYDELVHDSAVGFGPTHPYTLEAQVQRAELLCASGAAVRAVSLLAGVADLCTVDPDVDDEGRSDVLVALADAYAAAGRLDEALSVLEQLADVHDGALRRVVALLRTTGELDQARSRAWQRFETTRLTGDEETVIEAALDLAETYAESGDTASAVARLRDVIDVDVAVDQPWLELAPVVVLARQRLAVLETCHGDPSLGLALLEMAVLNAERTDGSDNLLDLKRAFPEGYVRQDRAQDAIAKCGELLGEAQASENLLVAVEMHRRLAALWAEQLEPELSIEHGEAAVALSEEMYGPASDIALDDLEQFAALVERSGDLERALAEYEAALQRRLWRGDDEEKIPLELAVARLSLETGDTPRAIALWNGVLGRLTGDDLEVRRTAIDVRRRLASAHLSAGRPDAALDTAERAAHDAAALLARTDDLRALVDELLARIRSAGAAPT